MTPADRRASGATKEDGKGWLARLSRYFRPKLPDRTEVIKRLAELPEVDAIKPPRERFGKVEWWRAQVRKRA